MNVISLLQTAAPEASIWSMIAPFALIFVIFYFFMIRPQNKKQKETQKMIAALKKGDKIVTIGGIHGVVSSTKEQTIIVKVDDNAKVEFSRSAIASVVNENAPAKKDSAKEKPSKVKQAEAIENSEEKPSTEDSN
ncbi:MAG: preprotein translocase subunit YajC [Spirochaetales bacterium]